MYLKKLISNLPGWRTSRKIVVIESDDWGSIRMPSLNTYESLVKKGVKVDDKKIKLYNTLDTLASSDDLECLFKTLKHFKDKQGNHPTFTALALSSNPDFEKIKKDDYQNYYFKKLPETLKDYNNLDALQLWHEGYMNKIFIPEFHGREHLNVNLWMKALQNKDKDTIIGLEHGVWGFRPKNANYSYQAAFHLEDLDGIPGQKQILKSGLELFKDIHKRKASFFVPPNGPIHQEIIDEAVKLGIQYVSSPKIHHEPRGQGKTKKRFRYLGKKGKHNSIYLTRNCFFEPCHGVSRYSTADCIKRIQIAFDFNKPAVISTHRINYIGGLSEKNRLNGNKALKELLTNILKIWPDVEFMSSVQLGDLIKKNKSKSIFN